MPLLPLAMYVLFAPSPSSSPAGWRGSIPDERALPVLIGAFSGCSPGRSCSRSAPAGCGGGPGRRREGGAVSDRLVVAIDAVVWATWSTAVGYTAHRLPLHRLAHDAR